MLDIQLESFIKLLLALGLSSLIGIERQIHHKPAGIRTHILVCLSSTLLTLAAMESFPGEAARIAAGVVTGMGFLGAGTIIASRGSIHGLTTAACLWSTAIIGVVVAIGNYILATAATMIIFVVLISAKVTKKVKYQ